MGLLKVKEDTQTTDSDRPGMMGSAERLMRRFRTLSFTVLLLPLVVAICLCVGLAAAPAMAWFDFVQSRTAAWAPVWHYAALGCAVSTGYLIYGISLIFIVPLANFLLPFRVRPFRGPWYSLGAIPWYFHNGLTYAVRLSFLDFVTPTPLNLLFYRMMGMKIGKGTVINTSYISDPCLITLGDHVTIGGSATLFAHYGQKGYLIVAPVVIGDGSNIGLKASVMGGATIGSNVTVKPHVCVLPKTTIADSETV